MRTPAVSMLGDPGRVEHPERAAAVLHAQRPIGDPRVEPIAIERSRHRLVIGHAAQPAGPARGRAAQRRAELLARSPPRAGRTRSTSARPRARAGARGGRGAPATARRRAPRTRARRARARVRRRSRDPPARDPHVERRAPADLGGADQHESSRRSASVSAPGARARVHARRARGAATRTSPPSGDHARGVRGAFDLELAGRRERERVRGHAAQRYVEQRAAARAPAAPRRERGVQSRERIRDRIRAEQRPVGVGDRVRGARGHRGVVAERDAAGRGVGAAVARDAEPDAPRALRHERLGVDPELRERARPRALDHDVRGREQRAEQRRVARVGEVEHDTALARVQQSRRSARTDGLRSPTRWSSLACRLAARNLRSLRETCVEPPRALDLDHVRARVREQLGAQRARPERGEVEHARRTPRRIRARAARGGTQPARCARRRGRRRREREPEPARALGEPRERPPRDLARGELPVSDSAPVASTSSHAGSARRSSSRARFSAAHPSAARSSRQAPPGDVRPRRASPSSAARSASRPAGSTGARAPSAASARPTPSAHEASAPHGTRGSASGQPVSAIAPLAAHASAGWRSAGPGCERTPTPRSASSRTRVVRRRAHPGHRDALGRGG